MSVQFVIHRNIVSYTVLQLQNTAINVGRRRGAVDDEDEGENEPRDVEVPWRRRPLLNLQTQNNKEKHKTEN